MNHQQRQAFYRKRIKALEGSEEESTPPVPPKLPPKNRDKKPTEQAIANLPTPRHIEESIRKQGRQLIEGDPKRKRPRKEKPKVEPDPYAVVDRSKLPKPTEQHIEAAKRAIIDAANQAIHTTGYRHDNQNNQQYIENVVEITKRMNRLAELGSRKVGDKRNDPIELYKLGDDLAHFINQQVDEGASDWEANETSRLRRALQVLRAYAVGLPADTPPQIVRDRAEELGLGRLKRSRDEERGI